jgi:hypothetical protein
MTSRPDRDAGSNDEADHGDKDGDNDGPDEIFGHALGSDTFTLAA